MPVGIPGVLGVPLAARFLLGVGEAMVSPASSRLVSSWIPSGERGLDLKSSSSFGMLPFVAMATFSPLGGWISDRLVSRFGKRAGRCGVPAANVALAAGFIVLGTQANCARVASILLACGAGALYLSTSSFWPVTADIAGSSSGSASGVMNMGNQIGGTVTASLTPLLANLFGWPASFLVTAALCVVGSLAWLRVDPRHELVRGAAEEVVEVS